MTKYADILTEDFLRNELKTKFKTQIAKDLGIHPRIISDYCKKFNIIVSKTHANFEKKYVGKEYGDLTILKYARNDANGARMVLCLCKCGQQKIIAMKSLKSHLTKSCGCRKTKYLRGSGCGDIAWQFYRRIKKGALDRGIPFEVTIEEIWDTYLKQDSKCAITGLPIKFVTDYNIQVSQTCSVDRIDSRGSYTKDNIQIIHKRINIMKGNMSMEEFKYWIYHTYKNLQPTENIHVEHVPCMEKLYEVEIN